MDFEIFRKKALELKKHDKAVTDVAFSFTKAAQKEFGDFLKAVILFGSAARKKQSGKKGPIGDIDLLLILDDVSIQFSKELVQIYRVIVEKLVAHISTRIHITSMKFSSFWEYVRNGDPVAVNILRDGVAILDTGFFDPMQRLLYQGRIRPSKEAMYTYFARAPMTLSNSKWHVLQASLDLYWAVIDAAHSVLMKVGEIPPTPEHVADLLDERLVKTGYMSSKYPQIMRRFYALNKQITHHEIGTVSGEQYDSYRKEAIDFIETMKKFLEQK
tara:strand:- start:273 stop:1088 length:816 start_codon:yes stop_codon:yes gene_type:complete